MANILDLYTDTVKSNNIAPMTGASRKWYNNLLKQNVLEDDWHRLRKDRTISIKPNPMVGKMYTFSYVAKHRKTLPYYDRYPLVILADLPKTSEGFYGLNLHYLRPYARALLLSKLHDNFGGGSNLDETSRMRLSYSLLKQASKVKEFSPTFKHYLPKNIRSSIVEIPGQHWELAVFLPTQRFVGANSEKVWRESRRQYS